MKRILPICIIATIIVASLSTTAKSPKKTSRGNTPTKTSAPAKISTPQVIDLGLQTKWADRNLGAQGPSGYGNYYAWGELKTKKDYQDSLCSTWQKNFEHYQIAGDTLYDAAAVALKNGWHMPSEADFQALIDSCQWSWTKFDNIKGYKVTGPSGKSIFLPAAGFKAGTVELYQNETGYYWSDEPISTRLAGCLNFDENSYMWFSFTRSMGLPIRPVK